MPVKSIPITLDKKRHLRYDFNAFCALEEELGISIGELGEIFGFTDLEQKLPETTDEILEVAKKIKLKNIRVILWTGLIHEEPTLTVRDVGTFIDIAKMEAIMEAVLLAINAAFPEVKKLGKKA